MRKGNMKYALVGLISLIMFVFVAILSGVNRVSESTDTIMPSIYIADGMTLWYVMLLGVLAEGVLVKLFLKESYLKSSAISLVMNLVTSILGFVTLHIISLIVEVLFIAIPVGTFHVSHWIANFLLIVFSYAALEGVTIKIAFKYKFKKTYLWLCLVNAVSFIICILFNLSWFSEMFF